MGTSNGLRLILLWEQFAVYNRYLMMHSFGVSDPKSFPRRHITTKTILNLRRIGLIIKLNTRTKEFEHTCNTME